MTWRWWVMVLVVMLGVLGRLLVGGSGWGLPGGGGREAEYVLGLRGWRAAVGLVVGSGLGLSGVALQALLRNALAEPYVLGVSSGAAAGVVGQVWLGQWLAGVGGGVAGVWWSWGLGGPWIGAMVGAVGAMGVVWVAGGGGWKGWGGRGGLVDPVRLLLVGVVLAAVFGAVVMAMNVMAGESLRSDLAAWMAGYLDEGASGWRLGGVAFLTGVGGWWLWARGRLLDAATLSEGEAASLGVELGGLRAGLYGWGGVLAAGAVALSGPIAFVGLIAAHLGRRVVGPGHRRLVPAGALCGAGLMVWADTAASAVSLLGGVGLLPVGVVTALVGGVVFVGLVRR